MTIVSVDCLMPCLTIVIEMLCVKLSSQTSAIHWGFVVQFLGSDGNRSKEISGILLGCTDLFLPCPVDLAAVQSAPCLLYEELQSCQNGGKCVAVDGVATCRYDATSRS